MRVSLNRQRKSIGIERINEAFQIPLRTSQLPCSANMEPQFLHATTQRPLLNTSSRPFLPSHDRVLPTARIHVQRRQSADPVPKSGTRMYLNLETQYQSITLTWTAMYNSHTTTVAGSELQSVACMHETSEACFHVKQMNLPNLIHNLIPNLNLNLVRNEIPSLVGPKISSIIGSREPYCAICHPHSLIRQS